MSDRDAAWERAERFVRDVLAIWGQVPTDETVKVVTAKVLKVTFCTPPVRPKLGAETPQKRTRAEFAAFDSSPAPECEGKER